jgi:hypothetical protein
MFFQLMLVSYVYYMTKMNFLQYILFSHMQYKIELFTVFAECTPKWEITLSCFFVTGAEIEAGGTYIEWEEDFTSN